MKNIMKICHWVIRPENSMEGTSNGQQEQVIAPVGGAGDRFLVGTPPGRDIGLAADDRDDSRGAAGGVEFDRPVEVAVIGERQRGHLVGRGALHHRGNPRGTVQQRILAVVMEMDEIGVGHGYRS